MDAKGEAENVLFEAYLDHYFDMDSLSSLSPRGMEAFRIMGQTRLRELKEQMSVANDSYYIGLLKTEYRTLFNAVNSELTPGENGYGGVWAVEPSSTREAANEPTLGEK
jgi:hypothetical protein